MGIVEQLILQLNTRKRRWWRAATVLAALSILVATAVVWNLRMTGITMANDATCGIQEHSHGPECPGEDVLICGYPAEIPTEETAAPAETEETGETAGETEVETEAAETTEPTEPHAHTAQCYQHIAHCDQPEHIHSLSCYSDETADIESAASWTAGLPQHLSGKWGQDIALVAQSQLGNSESARNFRVAEDGVTRQGITRYGQWYGNPHGDWSAMFAMFCLHYGQVPQEAIPWSPGVYNMMRLAQERGMLLPPDTSIGALGNLVFLDHDGNGNADRVLIVLGSENGSLNAIAGDWNNAVEQVSVKESDPAILGYIHMMARQTAWEMAQEAATEPSGETTAPTEASSEPSSEPTEPGEEAPTEPDESEPTEPDESEPTEPTGETEDPTGETEAPTEPTGEEPGEEQPGEETPGESQPASDEPAIEIAVEFSEDDQTILLVAQPYNIDENRVTWQWQVSEDGAEPWYDIETATGLTWQIPNLEETAGLYYRLQARRVMMMFAAPRPDRRRQ